MSVGTPPRGFDPPALGPVPRDEPPRSRAAGRQQGPGRSLGSLRLIKVLAQRPRRPRAGSVQRDVLNLARHSHLTRRKGSLSARPGLTPLPLYLSRHEVPRGRRNESPL